MFETTTEVMTLKVKDAIWPFQPENQPKELNPATPDGNRRVSARSPNEMYGPLWIMFTLIVSLVVMSHLIRSLRSQIGFGIGVEQDLADSMLVE